MFILETVDGKADGTAALSMYMFLFWFNADGIYNSNDYMSTLGSVASLRTNTWNIVGT